jgi:hypothetical protein
MEHFVTLATWLRRWRHGLLLRLRMMAYWRGVVMGMLAVDKRALLTLFWMTDVLRLLWLILCYLQMIIAVDVVWVRILIALEIPSQLLMV